jgi:hypothetical protein
MKTLLLSTSLVLLVGGAMAQDARHTDVITPDAVKWTENPAFPKGVQIATLVGDPTKAGKTADQSCAALCLSNSIKGRSRNGGAKFVRLDPASG